MNTTDKTFLIGVTAISIAAYIAMNVKKKNNKPVRLFGLDPDNSLKFVGAVAIVSVAVLAYPTLKNKLVKA